MSDPIKHVVLLMMENRSFDHMLGGMQTVIPGLDGVNPAVVRMNHDASGQPYPQAPTTTKQMKYDPMHEHVDVMAQLANGNGGFILDFVKNYPASTMQDRQEVMDYYPADFLPALHALARDFTVCDRWYASVPGPTWANRFFALSGTSLGRILMPKDGVNLQDLGKYFQQTQETVFERLSQAGKSWRVYYNDFPSSWLLLRQLLPQNLVHYRKFDDLFKDVLDEGSFPSFVFIEPKYFGEDENDDHPPHNIIKGEKLIADIYNAIRSSAALWESTLLVVVFDEHGGFYDHVTPPGAIAPDQHREEWSFDQLGVRVPALLISQWVSRGVEHTQFDHTSLLQYLTVKWNLGDLGKRTAEANNISVAIKEATPRQDTVPFIRVPYRDLIPPNPDWEKKNDNDLQKSFQAFAGHLEGIAGTVETQATDLASRMEKLTENIAQGCWKLPLAALGKVIGAR